MMSDGCRFASASLTSATFVESEILAWTLRQSGCAAGLSPHLSFSKSGRDT